MPFSFLLPFTLESTSLLVQFSHSVMSDSFWPHGLQQARPPYPSPTPGAYTNSCPLSWWCHPTTSSSLIPFSSCLQSFPSSGSFQMSQFFTSGGQNIGVSDSTSVLTMNTQDWFPVGWTGQLYFNRKKKKWNRKNFKGSTYIQEKYEREDVCCCWLSGIGPS